MKSILRRLYHGIAARAANAGRCPSYHLEITELRQANFSFSQMGEDRVIDHCAYYMEPSAGYYIDVGCYDPVHYSNTFLLWKRGFTGINIDIDEAKIARFNEKRPNDINLCAYISDKEAVMDALEFSFSDLNRLVPHGEVNPISVNGEKPIRIRKCVTQRLDSIVASSVYANRPCILLNIDCEGLDENVLEGADLPSLNPFLICIEAHGQSSRERLESRLTKQGYRNIAFMKYSLLYMNDNWK
jgi:hypothetical protein